MDCSDRLAAATRAFGRAGSVAEVQRLIDAWAPQFHEALHERLTDGPRPTLGMDIASIPGRGGMTARLGDSYFVGIGKGAKSRERRFVLAHELAHIVLDANDSLEIDACEEEILCDRFAGRALFPPARVKRHLRRHGFPRTLPEVKGFADRFRVTLRASLVALNEIVPAGWPVAFVAATWRVHPRGDGIKGMRIDTSAADSHLLFPRDCRLSTLGYAELEAWTLKANVGEESQGTEADVSVKSRRSGVPSWTGRSEWAAWLQLAPGSQAAENARGVLCRVRVDGLAAAPPKPRRSRSQWAHRAPPAKIPGQLDIAH